MHGILDSVTIFSHQYARAPSPVLFASPSTIVPADTFAELAQWQYGLLVVGTVHERAKIAILKRQKMCLISRNVKDINLGMPPMERALSNIVEFLALAFRNIYSEFQFLLDS